MDSCINFEALRASLINSINHSNLTVGGALFVVKDIYNTLYLTFLEEMEKEKTSTNTETTEQYVLDGEEKKIEEVTENGEQNND